MFTLNLVDNLKRAGVPWKLCIVCADKDSYAFFRRQNINVVKAITLVETGPNISPFGTVHFQKLNRLKLELLSQFTSYPEIKHGIYMDGDIAVYNDFVPDIISRLEGGLLVLQCDESGRADCSGACPNVCSGFIGWSHGVSPAIFKVGPDPESLALWRKQPEDQVFINARLCSTSFKTLPRDLYPNGQFMSLYSPGSPLKRDSKILHYNYTVGMDKQRRMRINGDWLTQLL